MQEFRLATIGELDETLLAAHRARSAFLRAALARLWAKLTTRTARPVAAKTA